MPRIRLVKPTLAHESAIRAYLDAVRVAGLPLARRRAGTLPRPSPAG